MSSTPTNTCLLHILAQGASVIYGSIIETIKKKQKKLNNFFDFFFKIEKFTGGKLVIFFWTIEKN